MRFALLVALALFLLSACAGQSFQAARREDTATAYHRFLREHPDSSFSDEARQRLELVKARSNPSLAAYRGFVERWPTSPLLPELRALVEEQAFMAVRAQGSASAYADFLAEFGQGTYADRARGNAAYLEARGFGGRADALAEFARSHPESDYAAEARRSADSVAWRARSAFRRAGLLIEVDPSVPDRARLAGVFAERAMESFATLGVELVPLSGPDDPRTAALPARLRIRHLERHEKTRVEAGRITSPALVALTTVTLERAGIERPVWSREFELRGSAVQTDRSLLFAPGSQRYWEDFFVPRADWDTRGAARSPQDLQQLVSDVDAEGDRAVVLFARGHFALYDLADPEQPLKLLEYRRPNDLGSFSGVRLLGDRVVIHGEDGLEVVRLGADGPEKVRTLDRASLGGVVALEGIGGALVAAGNRGLTLIEGDAPPELLVSRTVRGLGRMGERLVFTDGGTLYVASLDQLRERRLEGQLVLGAGTEVAALRVGGSSALLLTERGALLVDLSRPDEPRLVAGIEEAEAGTIQDIVAVGGQVFLLGERGLGRVDLARRTVLEATDVDARQRLVASGRHLVMVGEDSLQVVDTTPWLAASAPASEAQ